MLTHIAEEFKTGRRFRFGRNWARFLPLINDDRIRMAQDSLCKMLELDNLIGKSFVDVGAGSGLFSLVAMNLGARQVHSFDCDPESVQCEKKLKERFFPEAGHWTIESGDTLDRKYLAQLGKFNIVYSWGVLHHTGNLRQAMTNVAKLVAEKGLLFVAIYNKQPFFSGYWKLIKRLYNTLPGFARLLMIAPFLAYFGLRLFAVDLLHKRNPWDRYFGKGRRGMSVYRDVVDWLGGYPFEPASPAEIFEHFHALGFNLRKLKTCAGGHACNEYVFQKEANISQPHIQQQGNKTCAELPASLI